MSDKNNEKNQNTSSQRKDLTKNKGNVNGEEWWQKTKDFFSIAFMSTRGVIYTLLVVLLLVILFAGGLGAGYFASLVDDVKVPSKEELGKKINNIHGTSSLVYNNNNLISPVSSDLIRTKVDSKDISQNIKNAIISTEDENFNNHNGVVPKAILRATLGEVVGLGSSSGGSTITQQLIKQQILGDSPTFQRKASEFVYARAVEKDFSKDQILTDYLNVSPFGRNNKGQNIAGVQEAAKGIFGKNASEVNVPQAAFIAGLPQSPITYSPYAADASLKSPDNLSYGLERKDTVLFNMYRSGYINKKEYDEYKAYDLKKDFIPSSAPDTISHDYLYYTIIDEAVDHIYDYLIKEDKVSESDQKNDSTKEEYRKLALQKLQQGGYTVQSTVDQGIYNAMQTAVANFGGSLDDGTGQVQVGNVLMDNKTGAVLGFIGGRNYQENQNNHAFDTKRSPGSSIKPILAYAPAIDQGIIGSASRLSDYPATYSSGQPIMHVGDPGTNQMQTVQAALNASTNIPAYWLYQTMLKENKPSQPYMEKMGYKVEDYSIESLPIGGGIDQSVVQQTNGYQTLANHGEYQKQHVVQKISDDSGKVIYEWKSNPTKVFSKATASIMNELLRGPIRSKETTKFIDYLSSANPNLVSSIDWTGKTGTSEDYTDAWLLLSSPTVTLGGWIGHDDNTPLGSGTGVVNQANYMANLVTAINNSKAGIFGDGQKFELDPSVTKSTVLTSTGEKPGKVEGGPITITLSGETTTSHWATSEGAPITQYRFAIGGSDANYADAWSKIVNFNGYSNRNNR
ncbi:transglycosylase domain-containing protein [Floricoccus penangensis]|uniref:Transglycosylase n=1 Tax=Floricoccus penangensis TaxID=1859475 RepID=A0A9Q5JGT7_9LACT|nr:transglycosylase domain-containing protein [Floricoccus penangensis]OFI47091.1 transglycosylase [Floricoccus penangensis]URZ87751.1 penicillin-binding protein [Floricoccus penangensis]